MAKRYQMTSCVNNGGLFIACNKERLDEYKRLATLGKVYGIESHVIAPSEVQKYHPLIAVDDVYGAMISPSDGTIDPSVGEIAFPHTSECSSVTDSPSLLPPPTHPQ